MIDFSIRDIIGLSIEDVKALNAKAEKGDPFAQTGLAFYLMFNNRTTFDMKLQENWSEKAIRLYGLAADQHEALATLMLGLFYEFGYEVSNVSYAKAISFYAKGYDYLQGISNAVKKSTRKPTLENLSNQFPVLRNRVNAMISIRGLCTFSDGTFQFNFSEDIQKQLTTLLPDLSANIAEFGRDVQNLVSENNDDEANFLYLYQDLLLMPTEIVKAAAGRDYLCSFLRDNFTIAWPDEYKSVPTNPNLDWAMGRCLIDDDDSEDNDYIISGLRIIAGHDADPLWQYRTGLWYEFDPESRDLGEALLWYRKSDSLESAATSIERIRKKKEYSLFNHPELGSAEDCVKIAQGYHQNKELANEWNLEAAVRGDESAIRRIEQLVPLQEFDTDFTAFYDVLKLEYDGLDYDGLKYEVVLEDKLVEFIFQGRMSVSKEEAALEARRKKEAEEEEVRRKKEQEEADRRKKKEQEAIALQKKKEQEEADRRKKEEQEAIALQKKKEREEAKLERKQELLKDLQTAWTEFDATVTKGFKIKADKEIRERYDAVMSAANRKKGRFGGKGMKKEGFKILELDENDVKRLNVKLAQAGKSKEEYDALCKMVITLVADSTKLANKTTIKSSEATITAAIESIRKNGSSVTEIAPKIRKAQKKLDETLDIANKQDVEILERFNSNKILLWGIIGAVLLLIIILFIFSVKFRTFCILLFLCIACIWGIFFLLKKSET